MAAPTADIELYLLYHMNFRTVHINVFHSHFEFDSISYNPEDLDQCMHLFLSDHLMMSILMEVKMVETRAMEKVEILVGIKEAYLEVMETLEVERVVKMAETMAEQMAEQTEDVHLNMECMLRSRKMK